jgi:hypothetical protein
LSDSNSLAQSRANANLLDGLPKLEVAMIRSATHRKVEALTREVDRALETDRRYFAKHTGRSYRLRPASPSEVEVLRVLSGPHVTALPGHLAWFTAVRQIAPGVRVRAWAAIVPFGGHDPPEAVCRAFYDACTATPTFRAFEDRLASLVVEEREQ